MGIPSGYEPPAGVFHSRSVRAVDICLIAAMLSLTGSAHFCARPYKTPAWGFLYPRLVPLFSWKGSFEQLWVSVVHSSDVRRFSSFFIRQSNPRFTGEITRRRFSLRSAILVPTTGDVCTPFITWLRPISDLATRSNSISRSTTASTKTFVAALVLNGAIAGVEIAVFTLVRRYFPLIYQPRSLSAFGACARPLVLP